MAIKAYEIPGKSITLVPTDSFEGKRYTLVTVGTNGELVTATAAGNAVGVLQTPGIAGEPCRVMIDGVSFVKLGGTVANGAAVEVGPNGTVVTADTGKVVGIALVGGAANDIGCILIK